MNRQNKEMNNKYIKKINNDIKNMINFPYTIKRYNFIINFIYNIIIYC